jgi:nickel-dependent lactate racemase
MEFVGRVEYGNQCLEGILPKSIVDEGRLIEIKGPEGYPPIEDATTELRKSLMEPKGPEGIKSLAELFQTDYRGGLCTILVDDHTRDNIHTRILLPILIEELFSLGLKEENLRILIASGTHRSPYDEEFPRIVGEEVWSKYKDKVVVHNCRENLVSVGEVGGVPVEIDRLAYDSEIIIPLTDMDYHYFAGVGGGPKQICPGISGERIINFEHLKMFGDLGFAENVEMGTIEGNPVFDHKIIIVSLMLERLAERGTTVYSILCTLDPMGRLVKISGGDVFETHKLDLKVLDRVYIMTADRKADVTIVTALTKGIDLYQAGKALNAACRVTKEGGKILLMAPCPDGLGSEGFRELIQISAKVFADMKEELRTAAEPQEVIEQALQVARRLTQDEVMRDFKIGKQKPVDILRMLHHVGWGHLHLLQDGLSPEEKSLLPFEYVGKEGDPPLERIRDWVVGIESGSKPDYMLIEDPGYLIEVTEPKDR